MTLYNGPRPRTGDVFFIQHQKRRNTAILSKNYGFRCEAMLSFMLQDISRGVGFLLVDGNNFLAGALGRSRSILGERLLVSEPNICTYDPTKPWPRIQDIVGECNVVVNGGSWYLGNRLLSSLLDHNVTVIGNQDPRPSEFNIYMDMDGNIDLKPAAMLLRNWGSRGHVIMASNHVGCVEGYLDNRKWIADNFWDLFGHLILSNINPDDMEHTERRLGCSLSDNIREDDFVMIADHGKDASCRGWAEHPTERCEWMEHVGLALRASVH